MMKKSRSRILWGCLCAVGCETLFGLSYICTKEATLAASALTLLGWRFFVAAAFMALCAASARFSLFGYAILTAAVLSYALYSVCVEKAAAYTSAELTAAMMAAGAAVFIPLALSEGWHTGTLAYSLCLPLMDLSFLVAVLYQGVGVPFWPFSYLIWPSPASA